jgi:hypothetical protein
MLLLFLWGALGVMSLIARDVVDDPGTNNIGKFLSAGIIQVSGIPKIATVLKTISKSINIGNIVLGS